VVQDLTDHQKWSVMKEPAKRIADGPPEESGVVSRSLRKPKHSVWLSLVVATAAFPCAYVLEVFVFFVVSLLYLITFKPYGSGEHWLIPTLIMTPIAVYISWLVYRRFRWGKVAAPCDGDVGHAPGGTESEHSTCKDAGQTSLGHGTGTGQ
jgi:hypothetical protein